MRLSVRSAQVVTLLGVLLFTAVFVGGTAYLNARFAVEDLGRQLMEQTSQRVRQNVDGLLQIAVAQGAVNADLVRSGAVDVRDHEGMTRLFLSMLGAQPTLSYISLGLETGEYWHIFRDKEGEISVQWLLPNGEGGRDLIDFLPAEDGTLEETRRDRNTARTPPYERPYYHAAKQAGISTWPETYIFLGAEGQFDIPGVTRATPARDAEGRFRGVFTADFDLMALSRYMRSVDLGESGIVFLLELRKDGKRRVIAHPEAPDELKLTAPAADGQGSEALDANEIDDPRVHALLETLPDDPARLTERLTEVAFPVAGVPYLGGFRLLGGEDRPIWVIAMLLPESEILGRVDDMNRRMILLALVGVAVVLALALVISNRISVKLERIARETAEVAGFELEAKPAVASNIAEISRLGTSLEEMKSGLRSFQRYVPRELVRNILASGKDATLGSERKKITVYFSDIAGFTEIAESLEPEALVELLSGYLGAMTREMLSAGATVDKYIGDAIMAFWGAPHDNEDQCWNACHTALANQQELARLRKQWTRAGHPEIQARIGLHTGEALVGNFGSENRLDYTAIGDTVNLASRLEGLNKAYGTEILMSEAVYQEVRERVVARRLDRVAVKGRVGGTLIFELLGLAGAVPEETTTAIDIYERALDHYFGADFEAASRDFRAVLERRPEDGPASILLSRSRACQADPPPDDWNGIYVHTAK